MIVAVNQGTCYARTSFVEVERGRWVQTTMPREVRAVIAKPLAAKLDGGRLVADALGRLPSADDVPLKPSDVVLYIAGAPSENGIWRIQDVGSDTTRFYFYREGRWP